MFRQDLHISDQELIESADGEITGRRAVQVRAHLAACWSCRARMADIESTIADFVRSHRQALDGQLPSSNGPRALLRARITQLAHETKVHSVWQLPQFTSAARIAALSVAIMGVAILAATFIGGALVEHSIHHGSDSGVASIERGALPERSLTPGATRSVAISEVCSMPHEEVVREVPDSIRKRVLQEYGIANARPDDYEIDYLIAPGLGGVEDIHNLWPEPSETERWNAHVKDALEERLHQLVCSGNLDLPTAQRDIATNWIAAYKKYFHTDMPLSVHSHLGTASTGRGDQQPKSKRSAFS